MLVLFRDSQIDPPPKMAVSKCVRNGSCSMNISVPKYNDPTLI
jgi:hypothetical protein